MNRTPPARRTAGITLAGGLLLALLLGVAGCSSDDGAADSAQSGAGEVAAEADEQAGQRPGPASASQARSGQLATDDTSGGDSAPAPPGVEPAVIQTGTLTVRSDDVAEARFDLGKVVDARGGTIADEETSADSEGEVERSRVVLRVPSAAFDQALIDLADLGDVTDSTRQAQDVTGEVIDTRARIRAQEQSLTRVEILFDRAQDIRDIVAIEAQLSRRQAELDSLKGQLAYLEDQTTLSTITVYLEATPEHPAVRAADDDNAFVGGLRSGWHALATLAGGLATVGGALLPFAVVALLLGVPAWLLLRRWLVRHPIRRHTPAPVGDA